MSFENAVLPSENIPGMTRSSHAPSSSGVSPPSLARRTTAEVTIEKGGGLSSGAQTSAKLKRKLAQPQDETDVRFLVRNGIRSSSGLARINSRMASIVRGPITA